MHGQQNIKICDVNCYVICFFLFLC